MGLGWRRLHRLQDGGAGPVVAHINFGDVISAEQFVQHLVKSARERGVVFVGQCGDYFDLLVDFC